MRADTPTTCAHAPESMQIATHHSYISQSFRRAARSQYWRCRHQAEAGEGRRVLRTEAYRALRGKALGVWAVGLTGAPGQSKGRKP